MPWLISIFALGCVFLAAACVPYPQPMLTQRAVDLVWAFYGDATPQPLVIWEPRDCIKGSGMDDKNGACQCGQYAGIDTPQGHPDEDHWGTVWVSWQGSYSFSCLSHELYHAHLERTTGNLDPQHLDPGFHAGGIVSQAEAMLQKEGL